jgi:hypothetical protein
VVTAKISINRKAKSMSNDLADQLARVAVDATEHPSDAVAALLKGGAIVLARTFGQQKAFEIMMEVMAETERDWTKSKTGEDVIRH